MNIYKAIEQENGNILLERIILDNVNYEILNENNGNILMKKIISFNITHLHELKNFDFKKSKIVSCKINDYNINKLKYKSILNYIYKLIDNGSKIIKNTTLNIKTIEENNDGFYYLDDIGISIQGAESNKCLLEIINQCIVNDIDINLKIKLNNLSTVNLDFLCHKLDYQKHF